MAIDDRLEQVLRARGGAMPQRDITAAMGLSQPSTSRLLRQAGDTIMRFGRGRRTCYALVTEFFSGANRLPIYAVDSRGVATEIGGLRPLAGGAFGVEAAAPIPFGLAGDSGVGLYDDLPYFVDDVRPQGFLGRQIAHRLGPPYPENPTDWNAEYVLRYLTEHGHDLPGNLIFGDAALERFEALQAEGGRRVVRHGDYPRLAVEVLEGESAGSSAGGEQPKFAVTHETQGAVIVKFSPPPGDAFAQRWRDLLIAEFWALETLREEGVPTARVEIHELDGRLFLESTRFDRIGMFGRRPMVSLSAIDAEFVGAGRRWPTVSSGLVDRGLVTENEHGLITRAQAFGDWINNSDMHLGNVSFTFGDGQLQLLPLYDMLPMRFAPGRAEIVSRPYQVPPRRQDVSVVWPRMGEAALRFWVRVQEESRLSGEFQRVAAEAIDAINRSLG